MKTSAISIKELYLAPCKKSVTVEFQKGLNYIKGQNGSGKTLLLDYIAGIQKDQTSCITGNQNVVYINQNIFFSDRLKGIDFLNFVYRLDNRIKEKQRFYDFVNKYDENNNLKVEKLLKRQWGMLSGGERKFLYSSILLSLDRDWYILDEPFAFLDADKKEIMWRMLESLINKGSGIIITSHEDDDKLIESDANIIDLD